MQTPKPIACFDERERDALLAVPASRLKELTRHRRLSVNTFNQVVAASIPARPANHL
jgi:hypothetical protein